MALEWLERSDLTIEDLVELSSQLLEEVAPDQTRYKVTARPDIRTLRYYINEGLLPKPLGYSSGRARFSGRHLLRLLLIKRMQAEHNTLRRIKEVLSTIDDSAAIATLGLAAPPPAPALPTSRAPKVTQDATLELAPAGSIKVPADVLRDPAKRKQLADNLESLARWLRDTVPGTKESP